MAWLEKIESLFHVRQLPHHDLPAQSFIRSLYEVSSPLATTERLRHIGTCVRHDRHRGHT